MLVLPAFIRNIIFCAACLLCLHVHAQVLQNNTAVNDSVTAVINAPLNDVSSTHKFLLGTNYRQLWATPVKLRVFHLQREKGGLTILQRGGGMQTKSLRLKDSSGKQWVLRTIQKYPERALPPNLRRTVAVNILRDQVSTAHPFAPLTVPPLAAALDIPHANPEIVYVPDDTTFGAYRTDFANAVFLFEEREPLDAYKTDNTEDAQQQLRKDNDVSVNEKIVLRARLLDMLLGDWDRHEDQWRWLRVKQGKHFEYEPIPRDRDQVYYETSGMFPFIVSHQWLKSKFQGFHDDIRDVNGFNYNARYFDRYFLHSLDEKDWEEQVNYVQQTLTDSLIAAAMHNMPDTVFALSGKQLINTLIARRNNLRKQALKYYRFISKVVEVPASDKYERFVITTNDDKTVDVNIHKLKKDGSEDQQIYHRLFYPDITKEVRLYGMDGSDKFRVEGTRSPAIKIRMIGGTGDDSFYISNNISKHNLYVYDSAAEHNILPSKQQAHLTINNDSDINSFNVHSFKYDRVGPIVLTNYSPDYGLIARLILLDEKNGFRKNPYGTKQELKANYSTGRKSFLLEYDADFKQAIGRNDLRVDIISYGPHNVSNFFGLGNNSIFINEGDKKIKYYRNRYDYITGSIGLARSISKHAEVYSNIVGQYYTAAEKNNYTKFLNEFSINSPSANVFGNRFHSGVSAGLSYNTHNDSSFIATGIHAHVQASTLFGMNKTSHNFSSFTGEVNFYQPLLKDSSLVIATRLGAGIVTGKPEFYQMMQLGGFQKLRGYRTNRFTGKSMLYNSIEARLKIFDFTSFAYPGTIGIIAYNDVGRVWLPGEQSSRWHDGYGGGIYITPAQLLLIQALLTASTENKLLYITFGYSF